MTALVAVLLASLFGSLHCAGMCGPIVVGLDLGGTLKAREEGRGARLGSALINLALYQAGLSYVRLDRAGDAVDRWEAIVRFDPQAEIAEKAWARAGDLYFQAEQYEDAKRCYQGLLENFAGSSAGALGLLRIAQCDYNAGRDAEALAGYRSACERGFLPACDNLNMIFEAGLTELDRTRERVRRLEAVVEASLLVNSTLDLEELARYVVEIAAGVAQA